MAALIDHVLVAALLLSLSAAVSSAAAQPAGLQDQECGTLVLFSEHQGFAPVLDARECGTHRQLGYSIGKSSALSEQRKRFLNSGKYQDCLPLALVTHSLCLTGSKFADVIRRRLKADDGFPAVEASSISQLLAAHMVC